MRLLALIGAVVLLFSGLCAAQQRTESAPGAVLRGLDKISGEVVDIALPAGRAVAFNRLTVSLVECRYPAGNPSGDAFAAIEVLEEGVETPVFSGWMMASAPALSAMDHPRYDIWVIRCATS